MSARSMTGSGGWQLILADLALILFLATLSALAAAPPAASTAGQPYPQFDPSQALFRPEPLGPSLTEWLADRPDDQRATLTIFARHSGEDRDRVWEQARALAASVAGEGHEVRVVITRGSTSDLYASLAYDAQRLES